MTMAVTPWTYSPMTTAVTGLVLVLTIAAWAFNSSRRRHATRLAADKLALLAAAHRRLAALPPPAPYIQALAAALPPGRVLLPKDDPAAFQTAMDNHWNTMNRASQPACVVRAQSLDELSVAVKHLAKEHALRAAKPATSDGLFAIRCSGANPAVGVSGVQDGVLLDLSGLKQIEIAEDEKSVVLGGGCLWEEVYGVLDKRGLAVAGGRSSPVGVGGSILGGESPSLLIMLV